MHSMKTKMFRHVVITVLLLFAACVNANVKKCTNASCCRQAETAAVKLRAVQISLVKFNKQVSTHSHSVTVTGIVNAVTPLIRASSSVVALHSSVELIVVNPTLRKTLKSIMSLGTTLLKKKYNKNKVKTLAKMLHNLNGLPKINNAVSTANIISSNCKLLQHNPPPPSPPPSVQSGIKTCPQNLSSVYFSSVNDSSVTISSPDWCSALGTAPTYLAGEPINIYGIKDKNSIFAQLSVYIYNIGTVYISYTKGSNSPLTVLFLSNGTSVSLDIFQPNNSRHLLQHQSKNIRYRRKLLDGTCDNAMGFCNFVSGVATFVSCGSLSKLVNLCANGKSLPVCAGLLATSTVCVLSAVCKATHNGVNSKFCPKTPTPTPTPSPAPKYGDPASCGFGPEWSGCLDLDCNALACCIIEPACEAYTCSSNSCAICASEC